MAAVKWVKFLQEYLAAFLWHNIGHIAILLLDTKTVNHLPLLPSYLFSLYAQSDYTVLGESHRATQTPPDRQWTNILIFLLMTCSRSQCDATHCHYCHYCHTVTPPRSSSETQNYWEIFSVYILSFCLRQKSSDFNFSKVIFLTKTESS